MKSTPKWWLLPPAVAALLVLGSLSMQDGGAPADAAQPAVRGAARTADGARREAAPRPTTPDLGRIVATLAGVLVLGGGGVLLLRRLRGPARAPRGASLLSLRQTLRLSPRQAVHAIEFDERLLLIGESERGLTLLEAGRLPDRAADELEVTSRRGAGAATAAAPDDDDDGAVPRNLVIPRPAQPPARRAPTAPAVKAAAAPLGLADFRNLLQQAGRS